MSEDHSQTQNSAQVIDGKSFSQKLRRQVAEQVASIKSKYSLTPGLAVVLVGEDPASQVYVRNKGKQTREAGMEAFDFHLPVNTSLDQLVREVQDLNGDDRVNGILVQLPLPPQVDGSAIINIIDPAKDVDGFHVVNAGRLATGLPAMIPCTPLGCLTMLKETLGDLSGRRALILGRSNIVGKPMASLLVQESCTVTVAHSRTKGLKDECRRADILIAAVGKPEMVRGDWITQGATVIDVGINRVDVPGDKSRLVGDVCFPEAVKVAGAITPVPGGVGPMTIACLLSNTVTAACLQNKISVPQATG